MSAGRTGSITFPARSAAPGRSSQTRPRKQRGLQPRPRRKPRRRKAERRPPAMVPHAAGAAAWGGRSRSTAAAAELAIGRCPARTGTAAATRSVRPAADHPADRGRAAARHRRGRGGAARRYRQAAALPARRARGAPGQAETARRRHAGPQARDLRLAAPAGHQALHDRDLHPRRALRALERTQQGLDGQELPGMGGRDLPRPRRALEDPGPAAHRQCAVPARGWFALRAPGIRSATARCSISWAAARAFHRFRRRRHYSRRARRWTISMIRCSRNSPSSRRSTARWR